MKTGFIEKAAIALMGISVLAVSSGATGAYLTTYSGEMKNIFIPGTVSVRVSEPKWDAKAAVGLTPGSVIPKNPTALNTGSGSAWIFLRVSVPVRKIRLTNAVSRRKTDAAEAELFTFTVSQDWELVEKTQDEASVHYVYGYKKLTEPGKATAALFESVTLADYLEGELSAEDILRLPVKAVAIQENVCKEEDTLADIYKICREQAEQV